VLVCIGLMPSNGDAYRTLSLAGKLVKGVSPHRPESVGICTLVQDGHRNTVADALVAALLAATEEQPSAKTKASKPWPLRSIHICGRLPEATIAHHTGAHLARWLTQLPANVLNPGTYRRAAAQLARTYGWRADIYDEKRLRRLGAGAFLAVTAASTKRDGAIVRLSYRPRRGSKRAPVALVGKGLCFDTGGLNLKTAGSMLAMHSDMAGSAVALGTLVALTEARYPHPVDAWLVLAENRIGPEAYTQQDIITTLNGTTVQVVHTDAEGRMVLADALTLAAGSRPAAIVDFATLTGACVSALTERMSGFFTNTEALESIAETAGRVSGERMHGFPMPDDFDEDLDSATADIAQCLIGGKGDHIYAARFLNHFVPPTIPWLHCDLSSAERVGGLAHVPHNITGFGVRFASTLLNSPEFLRLTAP
jgi:leucyl aminopeptidase